MMKQIFIYAVVAATAAVRAANETDTAAVKSAPERNPTAVMAAHERNPTAVMAAHERNLTAAQDLKPAAKKATKEDGLLVVRVSESLPVDDCVQTLLDLEVKNILQYI